MSHLLKLILNNILWKIKFFGSAMLLVVLLRVFIISSFLIPSPSMEPEIIPGDYILINKLTYGARIAKNLHFMKGGKFETFRIKGLSKVKRNDVVVFNYPYSDWDRLQPDLNLFYIKRCVAIPGDTFYIDNGIYHVKNCPDTLGCYFRQLQLSQTREQDLAPKTFQCFPQSDEHHWNIRSFGPLYIPQKGDIININLHNIKLYQKLISYESNKKISIKQDGTIYLGDNILNQYVFLQNYYFMAGDYVQNSRDSRYWGLLPEDHIVGKASLIWKSEDMHTGKFRWKRFFKAIN